MAIYKRNPNAALSLATSANGTARNGANQSTENMQPGAIIFECYSAITTADVAATFNVQVSMDGSTFYDLKSLSNVARVATAIGTGVEVETRLALIVPGVAISVYKFFRCQATLAGAATAAADKTRVTYRMAMMGAWNQ